MPRANTSKRLHSIQKAIDLTRSPRYAAQLARIHALAGRKAEARKWIATLGSDPKGGFAPNAQLALLFAALGEMNKASEKLELACEQHDPELLAWKVDPEWEILRADAHCHELLTRMRLPD